MNVLNMVINYSEGGSNCSELELTPINVHCSLYPWPSSLFKGNKYIIEMPFVGVSWRSFRHNLGN